MQSVLRAMSAPASLRGVNTVLAVLIATAAFVLVTQGWTFARIGSDGSVANLVAGPMAITMVLVLLAISNMSARGVEKSQARQDKGTPALDDANVRIEASLESMLNVLRSTLAVNDRYGDTLAKAQAELCDPDRVHLVIKRLISENTATRDEVQALNGRLEAARSEAQALRAELESTRNEGFVDSLTGVKNRRWFDTNIDKEIAAAHANLFPLCLAMVDIDHFKRINDTYGHRTGDNILNWCGKMLLQNVKGRDTAIRYGGEEFAIILPRTGLQGAASLMETLRAEFQRTQWQHKSTGRYIGSVTASFGIAELRADEGRDGLLERADANLYAAKQAGRNRVVGTI